MNTKNVKLEGKVRSTLNTDSYFLNDTPATPNIRPTINKWDLTK